jgi:aspartate racemase
MKRYNFFLKEVPGLVRRFSGVSKKLPTIGIAGVTIPGAADCMSKINKSCRQYFVNHEHPNIILHQLNFNPTHHAQNKGRWDIVEDRLIESINALAN